MGRQALIDAEIAAEEKASMPATSKLEEIIASKAARGKYLFQSEAAILPHPFPLTNGQRETFEKRRAEIKVWLTHREMFIELVHWKVSVREAREDAMKRFEEKHPEYTREAIAERLQQNITFSSRAFVTLEREVLDARERFMENEPSGISLQFLNEDDALEFRLRWL